MTKHKGEEEMNAGVKPIQPMNIEFETNDQFQKFVNWASGQGEKTKATENVRNKFAAYIKKQNRG
ncbi:MULTISPECIES: hypothetical protein [Bacillus cereus group]|uniref:Uncharacterized protein n=1 Tax=Bacillus mycoides TaxID=1405 RepID=A0A4V5TPL7_BACMY|nr:MULTISPECIES: hypothetical protein [Bacillus cereus group]PFN89240.1 hypothetical protein COJ76_09815 [Bacillus thuringiensis]PGO19413.1 hypothetical protein CN974_11385 [Bacillus thuringiensis]TKI79423.1 hypothetical protein FC701_31790 [Bacillus mycoides]